METLWNSQFNWRELLTIAFALIAFYFALRFIRRFLPRLAPSERIQAPVKNGIHYLLLIYEPLALLLISSVFIMINPFFHGLLLVLLLLPGFAHMRNYISGRIVQFDDAIAVGKRLQMQDIQGIIAERGRLGLKLRTGKGLHFINYSNMLSEGYLLMSGEEIGGLYHLKIRPNEPEEKTDYAVRLMDLLASTPYLDWTQRPELVPSTHNDHQYEARVLVKEENHLLDLVALIEDWDYSCKILDNKH